MWISPAFKYYMKVGLKIVAIIYLIDRFILPGKKALKSPAGLKQPRLNLVAGEQRDLIDAESGTLALQGWEVNGEKMVNDNSAEHSLSFFHPSLAPVRERAVNIFFI